MAMTENIVRGMVLNINNEPHIVIDREFYAPAKGGSFNRLKMKGLKTGKIISQTIRTGERVEEVEVTWKTMQYLYEDGAKAYFMDPQSFEQVNFPLSEIPAGTGYLHTEARYIVAIYEDKPISVQLPPKITLTVTATGIGAKGDTVTNATKEAEMETGVKIQVPLFVKNGDKIMINTETNSYASKA